MKTKSILRIHSWNLHLGHVFFRTHTHTEWNVSKYKVFSGPYFPALRIQSECGKIRTRKTPYLDTFHAVIYQVPKVITLSFRKFIHERLQLRLICKVKVSVSSTPSSILNSFSLKRLTYEGLTSGNFLMNPKPRRKFFSNFAGLICRNLEHLLQI